MSDRHDVISTIRGEDIPDSSVPILKAGDYYYLLSVLGVEQLAEDIDFSNPPGVILNQLDIGNNNEEGLVDDNIPEAQKKLLRFIMKRSLENAWDRFTPGSRQEELRPRIKAFREKYIEGNDNVSSIINEGRPNYLSDRNSLLKELIPLGGEDDFDPMFINLDEADHPDDHVFLRFPGKHVYKQGFGCNVFTAKAASAAMELGVPLSEMRTFVSGPHVGLLIPGYIEPGSIGVVDVINLKTRGIYSSKIRPNDMKQIFTNGTIDWIQTIGTFMAASKHNSFLVVGQRERDPITFLPVDIGLLVTELAAIGAYLEARNMERAERYWKVAFSFDPQNSYLRKALEIDGFGFGLTII